MKITFLGHATLLIETAGKKIIVDPFISGNPLASDKFIVENIEADYILVTHAHQDHVLDVQDIAEANPAAKLISNYEIVTYFSKYGIDGHPMNHGGSWNFDFGRITMVNAWHSSSFADGTYGGNPAGYVIESDGKAIYIAGDTGLTMDMKLIPIFAKLDLAVLPIGDNFTMGIDSAVVASDFVECNKVLGYHYDTFDLIKIDHQKAVDTFNKAGKDLILLPIGNSIEI
jgi:L-ascorbate metabolism protein UlaG (beta-lactamase superfamily)